MVIFEIESEQGGSNRGNKEEKRGEKGKGWQGINGGRKEEYAPRKGRKGERVDCWF